MAVDPVLRRLAAFTLDPAGGNPAGVWIGPELPQPAEMQRIAAEVGYSETAFLAPDGTGRPGAHRVRYFSPAAEVPFCGHATIASGVAMAEASGPGRFLLTTNDGHRRRGVAGPVRRMSAAALAMSPGPSRRSAGTVRHTARADQG
jgi:PhzF family phenazine biosynthesis protein